VNTEDIYRLDLKVGSLELDVSLSLTLEMTHPRGREASAPGKTYLFILSISFTSQKRWAFELTRDPS
jgi:hypothetical protein